MKTLTYRYTLPVLLLLVLPVLLAGGCGSDLADSQGCPSGSYPANATDTITGSPDSTFVGLSSVGAVFSGGSVLYTPVTFTVTDSRGVPRNNVCLSVYTGDTATGPGPFWYTDATYGTVITGTGPYNYRTVATNDAGVANLYWSTAVLPPGNPRTLTTPPSTYTAGTDQAGTSYIQVYSGAKSDTFNVNWTVKGEPAT